MPYEILLHPKALKGFRSLPASECSRLTRALRRLEIDPFTPRSGADIRKLRGTKGREDLYRIRLGRYRATYGVVVKEVRVTDLFERGAGHEV